MNGPLHPLKPKAAVRVFLPEPALRAYVTFYYFIEAFEPLVDFLYPEWGNVRFALSGEWRVLNDPRDLGGPDNRTLYGPTRPVCTGGDERRSGSGIWADALRLGPADRHGRRRHGQSGAQH